MSSSPALHASLLRPAVIHILRAAGFYAARPSVVDTLTDICSRYLSLLAQRTADSMYERTGNTFETPPEGSKPEDDEPALDVPIPTVTDIRIALASTAVFTSTSTVAEETWREYLRKPLSAYPEGAREKERQRREAEDTKDIQEFLDWITGSVNREIRRIAGVLPDEADPAFNEAVQSVETPAEKPTSKDDFLSVLKKKHSKTGDEARYAGTVLGKHGEEKDNVKIDGGPPSLAEWRMGLKRKRADTNINGHLSRRQTEV